MRRLLLVLAVALLMAAMVAMSAPAFATQPLEPNPNTNSQGNNAAQASALSKHNGSEVREQAQSGQRNELVEDCKAKSDPTTCGQTSP
jgi:hypothetical protein